MEILIGGRVRDAVDVGRFGDVVAEVEVEVELELDVDMEVLIGVGVGVDIGDTSLSCSSCVLKGNVSGKVDVIGGAAT